MRDSHGSESPFGWAGNAAYGGLGQPRDHIRYSRPGGFSGITPGDKEQWLRKYPYVSDFETTVKEAAAWLAGYWQRERGVEERPREFLDRWLAGEWMAVSGHREPETIHNPEQLSEFIEQYFQAGELIERLTRGRHDGWSESLTTKHYHKALGHAVKLREVASDLPVTPAATGNPTVDLRKLQEWCVEARQVIGDMLRRLDPQLIGRLIELFVQFRDMPISGFPKIDAALFERAQRRARRILSKYTTRKRRLRQVPFMYGSENPRLQWVATAVSEIVEIAREGPLGIPAQTDGISNRPSADELSRQIHEFSRNVRFYVAAERIYRLMDKKYSEALYALFHKVGEVSGELTDLYSTPAGELLDAYERVTSHVVDGYAEEIVRLGDEDEAIKSALFGSVIDAVYRRESRESLIDKVIEVLKRIQTDAIRARATEQEKRTSGKRSSRTQSTKKFQTWRRPGDACFIIEGNRILFHRDGTIEDLRLKSYSKVQNLLVMLQNGTLQSCDVKDHFCPKKTKPIQVVSRANQQLNDSIRRAGFTCLPEYDVEFIRYCQQFDHYEKALPIYPSKTDFARTQQEDREA